MSPKKSRHAGVRRHIEILRIPVKDLTDLDSPNRYGVSQAVVNPAPALVIELLIESHALVRLVPQVRRTLCAHHQRGVHTRVAQAANLRMQTLESRRRS